MVQYAALLAGPESRPARAVLRDGRAAARSREMSRMINALLAVAVAYAAVCALVFLFQPRLVYFPQVAHEVNASPLAAGLKYEDVVLDAGDGVKVHAWWIPAREPRGAMLFTHGNAGNISHRV